VARVDRSAFLPNVSTAGGLAYTAGLPQAINGQQPSIFQLNYSELVFDRELRGRIRAEEDHATNQESDLTRQRDLVIARTAACYLELASVRQALDVLRDERRSTQEIEDYDRKRSNAGLELPIEVTRSELSIAKVEQRITAANARNQLLTAQLENLTGLPPERLAEISTEKLPDATRPVVDFTRAAEENSGALKDAETEQKARQHVLEGERGSYWPSIAVLGQYNVLSKVNNYQEFYQKFPRNNVTLGILVKIPIFNSRNAASVSLTSHQLVEADLDAQVIRQNTDIAALQTANNDAEQEAALVVARLEVQLADENLALLQSNFDRGQVSVKDLEESRLAELDKKLALLDAGFALQRAQLQSMQMNGQLTQVFK